MPSNHIECSLLATLAEVFSELSRSSSVEKFSFRESFGRGASLDVETQTDGKKDVVSISVYPAVRHAAIVLQINDQLFELRDSVEELSGEVRNALRITRKFRQIQPN